ncbi:hypothetical protein MKX08_002650, partial [Trichoderma sp. CBMAI-0020]
MAEASSLRSPRAVHIRAPPSLTSCIDVVNRATAPYHNERPTRGAIISFDFKYSSSIFFVEKDAIPKFDLTFMIQFEDEYRKPVEIQAVVANHFSLDNNIAKLLKESKRFPTLNIKSLPENTVKAQIHPLDNYRHWGANNVRFVVLSNVYPSNIDVSVLLSTRDGTRQLPRAFVGANRHYIASSPNDEKLYKLLCWTAELGYDELFKAYLDQIPAGLEIEDAFGMTPFSRAAQNGRASIVRSALQQAGSVCARRSTARGPAPLEAAANSQDQDIFELFVKWLKYLDNPISVDTTPKSDEIPEAGHDLSDVDIEREIQSAVRNDQIATIQKLVKLLRDVQGEGPEHDKWLANKIVKAAEDGELCLVQALRSCGADVNCKDNIQVTPLVGAIKNNHAKVAEYLILQNAQDDDNIALKMAVKNRQHSTIGALLKVKPLEEETKKKLLQIANQNKDSTTLMLLKLGKETEMLPTRDNLCPDVDKQFYATVVDFFEDQSPEFRELTVDELLKSPDNVFDLEDKSKFKWFHLPANNMKWAEALISKIYYYDPSLAYKVLEPKRWIKRQHEGESGSPHARFMMPTCYNFQEAFDDTKKMACEEEDRHVVLFMPYLHWDYEEAMQKRSDYLASKSFPSATPPSTAKQTDTTEKLIFQRQRQLIEQYLLPELGRDRKSRHLLHVRRTLDQSLYHNLKDTKLRDADQTVRRYQIKLRDENKSGDRPFTVIMVDQLWLWILLGPSGKAQTVVTCFPSRDWLDVNDSEPSSKILDPQRISDVLQTTKSYIQQRPDAVKTPYDLAGVIASRCSRALLDHSTDMLDFAEVYENSISDITNKEAGLETKDSRLPVDIRERLKILESKPSAESIKRIKDRCWEYLEYARLTEIPDETEMKKLQESLDNEKESLSKLLEKFGRFFVLDITREVFLLRQIKDIQDELEMMGKIFEDQKEVIESMDRIIRAMIRSKLGSDGSQKTKVSITESNLRRSLEHLKPRRKHSDPTHNFFIQRKRPNTGGYVPFDDSSSTSGDDDPSTFVPDDLHEDSQKKKDFMKQAQSMIWQFRHQKHNLPLRTIDRFAKLVKKMNERAKNTNKALTNLVDLKQKQSTMIDTRTARLQAEESHKMALQSESQGRTLMVFTVVTIVFLPLSFIAAFFAIPVKEFGGDNILTLDFVSSITC